MHAAARAAGCTPPRVSPPKKWWCPELSRLRDRLRMWREMWTQMKKPRQGTVFECYKNLKREYRKACRKCANNVQVALDNALNTHHRQKNSRALWNTIRQRQHTKVVSHATEEDFAAHYASIMGAQVDTLNAEQQRISAIVRRREEELAAHLNPRNISPVQLSQAMRRLRFNAAAGADGIRAEHLRYGASEVLLHALCDTLNTIFTHGLVPEVFSLGLITPILKKATLNTNDPGNYRPITVGSIFAKLAETTICITHIPCDTQFGFRRGRSTSQPTSFLSDLISVATARGSPVYVGTLDAEKCFDAIWHAGLFYKLMDSLSPGDWLFLRRW